MVGQADHGNEAIALTAQLQPDIILMDVQMPICEGSVATREIHQRYPWIRILLLTTFDRDEYIWQSPQAGALKYILKSTPFGQVAAAIRTLHQGYSQLEPTIAAKVFARINPPSAKKMDRKKTRQTLLLILLIINVVSTSLHYTDNFLNNDKYPEPAWGSLLMVFTLAGSY